MKGLHNIQQLTVDKIHHILDLAKIRKQNSKPLLEQHLIGLLFLERSTRTRCSFELAARRTGADVISLEEINSSIGKGETALDTCKTLVALGITAIVLRTSNDGDVLKTSRCGVPIINAGEGTSSHPTQGLLDAQTLLDYFNGSISGKTFGIVGDILHSRVAKSDISVLTALGANIILVGPESLVPDNLKNQKLVDGASGKISIERDLDSLLSSIDGLIMLRVQFERQANIENDYILKYQLDKSRFEKMSNLAPVLHPGPVNRGIEIVNEVADNLDRSLILQQVSNGIPVREAVLIYSLDVI